MKTCWLPVSIGSLVVRVAACALLLGVVATATAATTSKTTFPGRNGLIAFNSEGQVMLVNATGAGLSTLAQTNSSDVTTGVSFSRDGTLVAYSAYKGSDPDVYVIPTTGGRAKQITFSRGVDVDPAWSPRGTIAFETNRNGGQFDIYTVDAAGRKPTRLTDAPSNDLDPAWSPKGDRIAYTVEAAGQRQIWVMNADGTGKLQLTNEPNFSENPNWSPDGSRIVFDSDRAEKGNLELYSMKPDGTDVKRLTNHPALDALPAYSPDGTRIVFVSDRLQKDSRKLFTMPVGGGVVRAVFAGGGGPQFQMVPDWQALRAGTVEAAPTPPGRPLPAGGVMDKVDPLYDLADAYSFAMRPGITYRVNLWPVRGCASVALLPPRTRSFAGARRLESRSCGGYLTYTPGPSAGGIYSLLVEAVRGTGAPVRYRLDVAAAEADDQGPGVPIASGSRRTGSVSGRSVDVVDLYRFEVTKLSTVRVTSASRAGLQVQLTTVTGDVIAETTAGTVLRRTLRPATYLVAVTAPPRGGGRYTVSVLVRVVTKTKLKANDRSKLTVETGSPVTLATTTEPVPDGGNVQIRVDYQDPRSGWVFRQSWVVRPGESVTFTPPAVGVWRAVASYLGTQSSAPSHSGWVVVTAMTPGKVAPGA